VESSAWPLREARKRKAWDILEVGPGTGPFTEYLAKHMGDKDSLVEETRRLHAALEAQGIQSTESGEGLRLLGRWLKSRKTQIQLRSRPMKATTAAKAAMAAHHLAPDGSISSIADAGCSGL